MDGTISCPRTSGGRRRSVRLRSARTAPAPVAIGEMLVVTQGVASRGGRRGRTPLRSSNKRPGPHNINELRIQDISELPIGQATETALHPIRKRKRQPSIVASALPMQTPSTYNQIYMDFLNDGSEPSSGESDNEEIVLPIISRPGLDLTDFRSVLETPIDDIQDHPPTQDTYFSDVANDIPTMETDRPWGVNDFDWRQFPDPIILPESRRETFDFSHVGPITSSVDPYDIFISIWDRQFMEHIASETNEYAQQVANLMLRDKNLRPNSRISDWRETTADELYIYFALILSMGVVIKSRIDEYWSSTFDIFCTPGFRPHMSLDRFLLLNRCLHFSNNNNMRALGLDASEMKLFKIRPVLDFLNKKFQTLYKLHQNITLNESLLQWKGWLDINHLIRNKAATAGIKIYELCESQTGYLWRFEVQTYKKRIPQQSQEPLEASTHAIVLKLMQGLENRGHTLWMDNFYNSPCLARRLKSLGIDCAGTLRTNRLFVPEALTHLTKRNMSPGQFTGLTSGDVDVMVWRGKNRVSMISTYHSNGVQTIKGSSEPNVIVDYNIMMVGVSKKDQMLAMYPIERKRTTIWYKKIFRRLLNTSVLNAYIIYKHNSSSPRSHRNFRISLIKSLLSKHSYPADLPPAITQNQKIDITHRLAEYPFIDKQRQRRRCKICKKRVHTFCVGCMQAVCIDPCFISIHS